MDILIFFAFFWIIAGLFTAGMCRTYIETEIQKQSRAKTGFDELMPYLAAIGWPMWLGEIIGQFFIDVSSLREHFAPEPKKALVPSPTTETATA